ncbi:hypothetical protein ACXYUI_31385, partial [Klebsiella pneumoniae]
MTKAVPLTGSSGDESYRPPAPTRQAKLLNPLRLISVLKRNPIECWAEEHFQKFVVPGGFPVGRVVIINHPTAIRRALLDNA